MRRGSVRTTGSLVKSGHAGWHRAGGSYDPRASRRLQVVLAAPFVTILALSGCGGDDGSGGGADIEGLVIERVGPYDHVLADLDYDDPAPSGGDHLPAPYWLNCGVYEGEVPDELAVHSLEHGAVWITYSPGLAPSQVDSLRSLAERDDRVIVSPYPGLSRSVVASAWGRQLAVDSSSDARIDRFVQAFRDDAKAPEAGGSCSGGRSSPR